MMPVDPELQPPYLRVRYLAEALDPIHVGTGEFRLGRVDNTIVREPGTNLPKIPGSSMAGVCRAYTAMKRNRYLRTGPDGKAVSCAGKGGKEGEEHCGEIKCPVCVPYGFAKGKSGFQGLAQFGDLRLLFFPVYTCYGPVWITSPSALEDAGVKAEWVSGTAAKEWSQLLTDQNSTICLGGANKKLINFGWLYLASSTVAGLKPLGEWTIAHGEAEGRSKLGGVRYLGPVLENLYLVSNALLPVIVDDQLEVRTSVSISPRTGAAEPGALFTYEAIPRATFFSTHCTYLNPALYRVPGYDEPIGMKMPGLRRRVEDGMRMIEFLGLGGSNTRGLGRMRVIPGVEGFPDGI